ncbi:MAG: Zn-ribbon domain-containing OB-fold protein, partial [Actinomycetota bacterium]
VVHTYTVTHNAVPGFEPPFAVVLVDLEEQKGLRLVSNLIGVPPGDVAIGTPVEVVFTDVAPDVVLPLFKVRET